MHKAITPEKSASCPFMLLAKEKESEAFRESECTWSDAMGRLQEEPQHQMLDGRLSANRGPSGEKASRQRPGGSDILPNAAPHGGAHCPSNTQRCQLSPSSANCRQMRPVWPNVISEAAGLPQQFVNLSVFPGAQAGHHIFGLLLLTSGTPSFLPAFRPSLPGLPCLLWFH